MEATASPLRPPDGAPTGRATTVAQSRRALADGYDLLRDGPVADAFAALHRAATGLREAGLRESDPRSARDAVVAAASAAWAAGDRHGMRRILAVGACGVCGAYPQAACRDGCQAAAWRTWCLGMVALTHGDLRRASSLLAPRPVPVSGGARADELGSDGRVALLLGRLPAARALLGQALASARSAGEDAEVPALVAQLAYAELREGRHQQARTHAEEGLALAHRFGQRNVAADLTAVLALVASIAEDLSQVEQRAEAVLAVAHPHGLAQAGFLAQWARARGELGCGRVEQASARLAPLVRPGARQAHFGVWFLAVPCYVEASVLAGRPVDTGGTIDRFAVWAGLGADPQAPAQLDRCRALVAAPSRAEGLFRRALEHHQQAQGPFEHARTHLAYGMWLRRRRRPTDARAELRDALMGFERCGARTWARRARSELRAAGGSTGPAGRGPLADLTPQQLLIARQVAGGATNKEVAAAMSISVRTVEYHLRNVFAQLGVRSRTAMAQALASAPGSGEGTGDRTGGSGARRP